VDREIGLSILSRIFSSFVNLVLAGLNLLGKVQRLVPVRIKNWSLDFHQPLPNNYCRNRHVKYRSVDGQRSPA